MSKTLTDFDPAAMLKNDNGAPSCRHRRANAAADFSPSKVAAEAR